MIEVCGTGTASVDAVWDVLADLESWGERLPTFTSVRRIDGPEPTAVGSRFEVRQPGLPVATYEVTDWRPGLGFTWVARSPGIATTARHDLEAGAEGTVLRQRLDWSGPAAGLIRLLLTRRARAMVESETESLLRLAR